MSTNPPAARIAIIGTGTVGSAVAYALLHGSMYSELLLVDVNPEKRESQVRDLLDAACTEGSTTHIRSATLHDAGGCDIIVITAGVKRRRGETKIQQLERTNAILQRIIGGMRPFLLPSTIILVVSNPVDVLTTLVYRLARLPSSQVIGLGTYLDTVRLRRIMGEELSISPDCIHADMLGTHDDGPEAEFPAWSTAAISSVPIAESPQALNDFNAVTESEWAAKSRQQGRDIANIKGAPIFSIASSVARIVSAIICNNKPQVPLFGRQPDKTAMLPLGPMPISHFQESLGCCTSMPAFLGRSGIARTVAVELNDDEQNSLVKAGAGVAEMVERLIGNGKDEEFEENGEKK